jgi:hypothetical protein
MLVLLARVDMDAYDISGKMKSIWMDHCDKNSGSISRIGEMAVVVDTPEGYREVVGLRYNKEIKAIELIIDKE